MPRNLTQIFGTGVLDKRGKALRKIYYFSEGLLQLALKGLKLDDWLFPEDDKNNNFKGASLQGGTLWLIKDEVTKLPTEFWMKKDPKSVSPLQNVWKEARVPRVTIERVTNASTIYQAGRVQFAKDCGLWFGVDWRKQEATLRDGTSYSSAFEKALALLEDEGLGGERSSGYGTFKTQKMKDAVSFGDPKASGTAYLLSRYIPTQTELPEALTNPKASYELVPVSGWLQTYSGASQRRKRQWMVTAGSLVCPKEYPAGCITDLKPEFTDPAGELPHSVYRSGLALAINWPQ
jgi:CRISPR-associated protein Csm4